MKVIDERALPSVPPLATLLLVKHSRTMMGISALRQALVRICTMKPTLRIG